MKIGVDAACWNNRRGYGRHARALLSHLVNADSENQYDFIVDVSNHRNDLPANARWLYIPTSVPSIQAARADGSRTLADIWRMSAALSSPEYRLLIFPTVYTYVPVRTRAKKFIFIHDVIPETYPALTFPRQSSRWLWRTKIRLAIWQADHILTVSEYSKGGIASYFGIDPQMISVVGEAPDPIFQPLDSTLQYAGPETNSIDSSQRLIAYVGGFGPHKNVRALLEAIKVLVRDSKFQDIRLVLVGENQSEAFYSEFTALNHYVQKEGLQPYVEFTGYLPDERVVHLLNHAFVFVLPSFMEGFGLPAVEAAACGCPVIATRESPLPHLLGDSAKYINPNDIEELIFHLKSVLGSESLRQCMRQGGLEAVRALTWESAAKQMAEVIRKHYDN
jgi:glycosyltransferase involved in cell wall biosynthesis